MGPRYCISGERVRGSTGNGVYSEDEGWAQRKVCYRDGDERAGFGGSEGALKVLS